MPDVQHMKGMNTGALDIFVEGSFLSLLSGQSNSSLQKASFNLESKQTGLVWVLEDLNFHGLGLGFCL